MKLSLYYSLRLLYSGALLLWYDYPYYNYEYSYAIIVDGTIIY